MFYCVVDLFIFKEMIYGIYVGDGEISLMMVFWFELVWEDCLVKEFFQGIFVDDEFLSMEGSLFFVWLIKEVSCSGVMGDVIVVIKEKGEVLLDCLVDGCCQAIEVVYYF